MSPAIPAPEYVSDTITGSVYKVEGEPTLVVGDVPAKLAELQPVTRGTLIVRYALTLLMPAGVVFIPGLFAAEKGGMLVGRAAWDFIQSQFMVHPRADVVGLGMDGKKVQALIREIDFGVPVRVFVYSSPDATMPTTEVTRLIIGANAPEISDLLTSYLPLVE